MTLEMIMREIRTLPVEDRKQLISLIVDTLTEPQTGPAQKQRSILEFEGIGAELWEGVDAQEYVDRLRSEWGDRP
jgi:hypothetical protein